MRRLVFALVLTGAAAPALGAPYYRAEPASRPARTVIVARENVWRCANEGCTAERGTSRPAIACAGLVREVGALASFSADGRAFDAEELRACNRRARAN